MGGGGAVEVLERRNFVAHMSSRTYFANECTAGAYDNEQYVAMKLLGKAMRFTVDVSRAGCGCNAALYLTSLRQNTEPSTCSDYYCDANSVCGVACAEIDIMEANKYAWHSTLHGASDGNGVGAGCGGGGTGWNGPRDWTAAQYSPSSTCIDTLAPFEVEVSFPVDAHGNLKAMDVRLSQRGRACPISVSLDKYPGMPELSKALAHGMTPIISYWRSDDMRWLDGEGDDMKGPCHADTPCGDSARFSNFSVHSIDPAAAGPDTESGHASGDGGAGALSSGTDDNPYPWLKGAEGATTPGEGGPGEGTGGAVPASVVVDIERLGAVSMLWSRSAPLGARGSGASLLAGAAALSAAGAVALLAARRRRGLPGRLDPEPGSGFGGPLFVDRALLETLETQVRSRRSSSGSSSDVMSV